MNSERPAGNGPDHPDDHPHIRPGGARGEPFPEDLDPGRVVAAWLESGDVVHLDLIEADAEPERHEFPWKLIDRWIAL